MLAAVGFARRHGFAAEPEVFMFGVADGPAAGLRRQICEREDPGFFFGLGGLLLALDRRRAAFQSQAMSLTDHGVLGDAEALSDLAGGQAFRPKFLKAADLFIVPAAGFVHAHRVS